jgi:hypothetical protein
MTAWTRITFRATMVVPHEAGDLDDALDRFSTLMDTHSYMEVLDWDMEPISPGEATEKWN